MTKEKMARHEWLLSQYKWHIKRVGAWHKRQAKFYYKAAFEGFSLSDMLSMTFMRQTASFTKSVTQHNALFRQVASI